MKRALLLLPALAAPLVAKDASSLATPSYSSLPSFHLEAPPGKDATPAHIAAKEKLDNIFVVPPSKEQKKAMEEAGYRQVTVVLDEKQKHAVESQEFFERTAELDACATTDRDFGDSGPHEWTPMYESTATVQLQKPRPGDKFGRSFGGVTAVHVERLFAKGASAELQITDLFVDPETAGAKLIKKSTMPLVRVAEGPMNADVYAAREDGLIHFVVRAPQPPDKLPNEARFLRESSRRLMAQIPGLFGSGHSECGFLRTTLRTKPSSGEMATIQASALLPPSDEDAAPPSGVDGVPRGMFAAQATKTRPFLINLSISQASTDKEPMLSVSYAWATKEAQQAF